MYPATHRGIVASITPISLPLLHGGKTTSTSLARISPYEVYQLDATAYPGNSGSPLYLPDSGRVVGVINKVFVRGDRQQAAERPSGITYAIPVQHVGKLLAAAGLVP
jgi:S1-C subfamily serine protease